MLAPLFPSYVFVGFDPQVDQWRQVNGTTGVRRLVGPSDSCPQAMPPPVMAALFARCERGIVRCAVPELEPGRQVRLVTGPFTEQLARVESLDDRGRVRVLLDILGGLTPLSVTLGDLAPA